MNFKIRVTRGYHFVTKVQTYEGTVNGTCGLWQGLDLGPGESWPRKVFRYHCINTLMTPHRAPNPSAPNASIDRPKPAPRLIGSA